ncbi:MAG: riboflavin kinase [Candidatus Paceibacterota bacterium]
MKISGTIIEGNKQGREIGFPTANIKITKKIEPGIYKGYTKVDSREFLSAIYIGSRRPDILETHLIDFTGEDIYRKNIEVEIQEKIREDAVGISQEEIKELIYSDILKIISKNV